MPTITFSLKDLNKLVGKELSVDEVIEFAHFGKGDFDGYDENADELKIDFGDTNLPYLWSVEGFARLIKGIMEKQKGIPKIEVKKSEYKLKVDKGVVKYRPYIACFIAKGHKLDDYELKQIIQLQEKFCDNYGRKRKKVSIGLYSYKRLKFPIHYKAVTPESIEFVPLEYKAKMNLKEILTEHPKGKDYAYVLDGFDKYPILTDDNGEVMSFIPVINSNFTGKLEIDDDSLFFEATGDDENAVNLAANIFSYALYERGFEIHSVEIEKNSKKFVTPQLKTGKVKITNGQIKKLFGLDLKDAEVKKLAEKIQYNFDGYSVEVPSYRHDILHPYDIIEDIGISYGYNEIEELPLQTFTLGSNLKIVDFVDKVREIVVGLGYQESMSPILTNKNLLYDKMNLKDFGTVEILEYMSENYSVVRSWIIPQLMEVFSKNKHVSFPQKLFEEGLINSQKSGEVSEYSRIALVSSHEKADYTEIRQALDHILNLLGLKSEVKDAEHDSFISGRVGRIIVKGKKVGYLGEINPKVLSNFGLEIPVCAMELNLTELFEVINKQ